MVTYPSTYGVFEEGIKEICQITHDNGGLVSYSIYQNLPLCGYYTFAHARVSVRALQLHQITSGSLLCFH